MPVIALPIFWITPMSFAVPSYLFIVLFSAFLYWLITKAMRQPVQDGFQSLIGTEAEIVSREATGQTAKYLIRSQGELWSAYSEDELHPGEQVNIVDVKGVGVVVKRERKNS
jgi:membrane protein implicated in regulation of membrane protease activity